MGGQRCGYRRRIQSSAGICGRRRSGRRDNNRSIPSSLLIIAHLRLLSAKEDWILVTFATTGSEGVFRGKGAYELLATRQDSNNPTTLSKLKHSERQLAFCIKSDSNDVQCKIAFCTQTALHKYQYNIDAYQYKSGTQYFFKCTTMSSVMIWMVEI